jgi:hypothetical protein
MSLLLIAGHRAIQPEAGALRRSSSWLHFHKRPLFEMCCNVQTEEQSQVGRGILLMGKAHEKKRT